MASIGKVNIGGMRMEKIRVMIVDDSKVIREVLTLFLLQELDDFDVEVTTVADGFTALDALLADKFDLVLTDNNMPGMLGSELAVAMRDRGCMTPIIMVTGDAEWQIPPVARGMMKAVVQKPIDIAELGALVRMTLSV